MCSLRDLPGLCPAQRQSRALPPGTAGAEHRPACADAQQTVPASPPQPRYMEPRLMPGLRVPSSSSQAADPAQAVSGACSVCTHRREERGKRASTGRQGERNIGGLAGRRHFASMALDPQVPAGQTPQAARLQPLAPPCPEGASCRCCPKGAAAGAAAAPGLSQPSPLPGTSQAARRAA